MRRIFKSGLKACLSNKGGVIILRNIKNCFLRKTHAHYIHKLSYDLQDCVWQSVNISALLKISWSLLTNETQYLKVWPLMLYDVSDLLLRRFRVTGSGLIVSFWVLKREKQERKSANEQRCVLSDLPVHCRDLLVACFLLSLKLWHLLHFNFTLSVT